MVKTASAMLDLGTKAPDFNLLDTDGAKYQLSDFNGKKALLVTFICNHCPYVVHIRSKMVELFNHWQDMGVGVVAINANDVEKYPDDSPEKMVEFKREFNMHFPYLFDADQNVAKAYQAACTPDFYLFDSKFSLMYRGQFDSSRPGNDIDVSGEDLGQAVKAVLAEQIPNKEQKPSIGCNIKWK